jgi:hypothetical protein
MVRRVSICLLALLLPIALFSQTVGKMSGTVTDQATGEPLAGVNVIIDDPAYTLGAATDLDGYFSILNVPVGTFTVRASYIGYKEYVVQNVRVSLGLTTELNFELEQTALEFEEVLVTAERPMIRKDETNTNIIKNAEDIENLPIRGMQGIAATLAGVVMQDNSTVMNIRGGRGGESAMYIDGVLVNDPYNMAVRVYLPNQAIEEMSVQTGGFNAEYGDAMSGIVAITTAAGADRYHVSLEAITDEFMSPEKEFLGTYSYGYNEYVMSLSGPIIPKQKHTFFVSGTRMYKADYAPSWGWAYNPDRLDEFTYYMTTAKHDTNGVAYDDTIGVYNYDFNARVPENKQDLWSFTGKLRLQLMKGLELKGSYTMTADDIASPIDVNRVFAADHADMTHRSTSLINATLTHTLSSRTFYDLKFNYYDTERIIWDPVFKENFDQYGDISNNPYQYFEDAANYQGVLYNRRLFPGVPSIDMFEPGAPYDDFFKNRTTYWGIDFDIVHQQGKFHTFKAGFGYKYHTMRQMRYLSPVGLAKTTFADELEKYRYADAQFYGYDMYGNEVGDGPNYFTDVVRDASGRPTDGYRSQEPYHPIIMSGYLQDKIEFKDLVLNVGLRYDRIDPNAWMFRELDATFDENGVYVPGTGMFGGNELFDSDDIVDSEPYSFISPRLGLSFPVTDMTVFHAQYGKFYQAPELQDLYLSPFYLDAFVNRGGYFTNLDNPNLRPPKTTSYEIGFKQRLGMFASLQLTAFYKETEDLVQLLNVTTDVTNIAFAQNGDFGNIKGLDIIFNLRRFKNLSATFNYEMQFADGTGSAMLSNFDIAWQGGARGHFPKFAQPLAFEQRHTGSLNLDYRWGNEDAPLGLLKNFGANLLLNFNSGRPYTLMQVFNTNPFTGRYDNDNVSETPVSAVNSQTTPWVYRLDLKVDKKIYIGSARLTVYAWVVNLLNTANVQAIWITTGLPDDTGFLGTTAGQQAWAAMTPVQRQIYKMREMDYQNYGVPRQIRLGVQIEL